jgi:hypothetical protein
LKETGQEWPEIPGFGARTHRIDPDKGVLFLRSPIAAHGQTPLLFCPRHTPMNSLRTFLRSGHSPTLLAAFVYFTY